MKKRLAAVATSLRFIPLMNTHGSVPRDLIESRAPPPSVSIHSLCHFAVKFTFRRQKYTFTFILPNFSSTFLRFVFKFRINTKNEPTNDGPVFLFTRQTRLPFHQPYTTPVGEGADCEVNPEAFSALLYQKLVEVLLRLISDV